jgi:hypothetical protein
LPSIVLRTNERRNKEIRMIETIDSLRQDMPALCFGASMEPLTARPHYLADEGKCVGKILLHQTILSF